MDTQPTKFGKGDALSNCDIKAREERAVGGQHLLKREQFVNKHWAVRLMAMGGIPLIVALSLILQLQKLPNSSLSYSLLSAVISLLFNFSSSALLKVCRF